MKFAIACLCVVFGLMLCLAQPQPVLAAPEAGDAEPEPKLDADYLQALLKLAAGDYAAAHDAIEVYIKGHPEDAKGYSVRANILFAEGKDEQALADYDLCLTKDDLYVDAYIGRARVYLRTDKTDEAERNLSAALKLDAKNADASYLLGNVRILQGKYDEAIASYSECLKNRPRDTKALKMRAGTYRQLGEYEKSITDLEQAIEFNRFDEEAWSDLGHSHLGCDNYEKAIDAYEWAIAYGQNEYLTYMNLGYAQSRLERPEDAVRNFRLAVEMRPELASPRTNLARTLADLGDAEAALVEAELALLCDDADEDDWLLRARLLTVLGRAREAVVAWKKLHDADPESSRISISYAEALLDVNRYEAAHAVLEPLAGDNPRVVEGLCKSWMGRHQPALALKLLNELDEEAQAHPRLLMQRVEVLSELLRFDEVDGLADRLDDVRPGFKIADTMRAYLSLLRGDLDGAQELLEQDGYPDAMQDFRYSILARISQMKGDDEQATEYFKKSLEFDPDEEAFTAYGKFLLSRDQTELATEYANKAMEADEWSVSAHVLLARCLAASGDKTAAKVRLSQAIDVNRYDASPYYERSRLHLEGRNGRQAQRDIEKAYEIETEHLGVLTLRAVIMTKRETAPNAQAAIEEAEQLIEKRMKAGCREILFTEERATLWIQRMLICAEAEDEKGAESNRKKAIAALQAHVEAGLALPAEFSTLLEFEPLHNDPEFKALFQK